MSIYCVYLTIYSGNKLPPFYIGSTSVEKINSGYRGSVSSKEYRVVWEKELLENPNLFQTKIIKTFDCRKDATMFEYITQTAMTANTNPLYINKALAHKNFMYGQKQSEDHIKKRTAHRKGKKSTHIKTAEEIEKTASKLRGRVNGPLSEEHKMKISQTKTGCKDSDATREKKSKSMSGKEKPWLKNKKQSQEHIEKAKETRKINRELKDQSEKDAVNHAISESLKGVPKNYVTAMQKPYLCLIENKKTYSKPSAAQIKGLKQFFW